MSLKHDTKSVSQQNLSLTFFPYPLRRFRIKAYIAVKLVFEIAQHIAYAAELVGRDKPHLVCFFICRLRKDDAEKQP